MQEVLKFAVDSIKLIKEISDAQLAIAEVKVCKSGQNLYSKPIDKEAIKRAIPTLINKFLVAGFDGHDFEGHEEDEKIIGFFPKENNFRFEENKNGEIYLIANAIVSKIYASWAFSIFEKDNFRECSMEILVAAKEKRDDGFEWITDFIFNGVTVVGKYGYHAASPGSSVEIIKFSADEMIKSGEKIYHEYLNFGKYDSLNFKIPENVQENAKRGLELRKKFGRGGTSVGLSTARKLAKGGNATPEFVRKVAKYFPRHAKDNLDDKESNGWIAWNLWGGTEGRKWSERLVKKMDEIDENKLEFASKDDWGSGDYSIEIDKSKDSVSTSSWGDVDKTALMNKVIKAKNGKSVIHDIYALVEDGYEEAPSQHLKYPIMQVIGNKAVYNKGALNSAEAYANHPETGNSAVAKKVAGIKKKVGLGGDEKKMGKEEFAMQFSMSANQMFEAMRMFCDTMKYTKDENEYCRYSVVDYDDAYMYCFDNQNGGKVAVPFSIEGGKVIADTEKAKMAKMVSNWVVEDNESYAETEDNEDVYMSLAKKFSTSETINLAEEQKLEFEGKISDLNTQVSTLFAENETLKKDKETRDKADRDAKVEFALHDDDVQKYLSTEKIEELRQDALNFALTDIETWVTKVNSEAFLASKDNPKQENFARMGLPFYSRDKKEKTGSVYDRL